METVINISKSFAQPVLNFLPKIPSLILTLIIGYLIIKVLLWILNRALRFSRIPRALIGVIISLAIIIMWVILFAELAREMGMGSLAVTISGSLAVLALALASGASGLTSDVISGVFLARDHDFDIGYKIKIADVEGIVQQIDIRKIRIVDEKGCTHIFPNTKLDKDGWQVISREAEDNKIEAKKMLDKNQKE